MLTLCPFTPVGYLTLPESTSCSVETARMMKADEVPAWCRLLYLSDKVSSTHEGIQFKAVKTISEKGLKSAIVLIRENNYSLKQ